jgi:hypothetical protein
MFAMGTEALEPVAGTHGAYGGSIIPADDTHFLAGAAVLSAVFGGAVGLRRGVGNGIVLG